MKQIKSIWFAIAVVLSCLFVHIRAYYGPFESILFALTTDVGRHYIPQFIIPAVFLIVVSFYRSKRLFIAGVLLVNASLAWLYFSLNWLLDFHTLSIVQFVMVSAFAIIYVAFVKR